MAGMVVGKSKRVCQKRVTIFMRRHVHVTGVVQGVGFRPFVYQLAVRFALRGWVVNTSAGVDMELEGDPHALDEFVLALVAEKPPLARIDAVETKTLSRNGDAQYATFEIRASVSQEGAFLPVASDVSICDDCLRELFDPRDRRYLYPFINCTNCGPRFTIIQDIPYDRSKTTMRAFDMCADCAREYCDPLDRRFHAQPVACPKCGPRVWLETNSECGIRKSETGDAIYSVRQLLTQGKIVAIKGLGGFHLACDATNTAAVSDLRKRKRRVDKPFALMMPDMATIEQYCFVNEAERALLQSRERPIVLLECRPSAGIAPEVAPDQHTLGVMLPYTPLHYLFFDGAGSPSALVMTSGNLSEEPIAYTNSDARERLAGLADAFLMHDRDILIRTDDSVVRAVENKVYPLRRSRGYAPFPVRLPVDAPPTLATGAEMKNAFCVTRDRYAFLSHHIGDLENFETLQSFEDGVAHYEKLFRVAPQLLAYDLHPDYLATRYALARSEREQIRATGVQHHHAHIASCMAENALDGRERVIGVAFDGTGYGEDGAIWGGEFLIADYAGYERAAHLAYVPLPGGDRAAREPWRMALAYLHRAGIAWSMDLFPVRAANDQARHIVRNQIERGVNAPLTSSMGRLFDAAASLAGVRQHANFEAQAAMNFEALADRAENNSYPFDFTRSKIKNQKSSTEIDASPVLCAMLADMRAHIPPPVVSARFHNAVALMTRQVCLQLRDAFGLNAVVLSGGVWQNMTLLFKTMQLLRAEHFALYTHRLVPANDGGIALGQAVIAAFAQRGA